MEVVYRRDVASRCPKLTRDNRIVLLWFNSFFSALPLLVKKSRAGAVCLRVG